MGSQAIALTELKVNLQKPVFVKPAEPCENTEPLFLSNIDQVCIEAIRPLSTKFALLFCEITYYPFVTMEAPLCYFCHQGVHSSVLQRVMSVERRLFVVLDPAVVGELHNSSCILARILISTFRGKVFDLIELSLQEALCNS